MQQRKTLECNMEMALNRVMEKQNLQRRFIKQLALGHNVVMILCLYTLPWSLFSHVHLHTQIHMHVLVC